MKKNCKSLVSLMLCAAILASLVGITGVSASAAAGGVEKFYTEYGSWSAVLDAQAELNKQIGAEGTVLLKNENNALPLARGSRISLFGKNSVDPVMSGTGSSGGTSGDTVNIENSLIAAGFAVNPALLAFYKDTEASGPVRGSMGFASYNYHSYFATAETPQSKYTDEVKASYADYHDAAVVVFSRTGGEGTDLPRTSLVSEQYEGQVPPASDARAFPNRTDFESVAYGDDYGAIKAYGGEGRTNTPFAHYLELDENEIDLLDVITEEFDTVIVIVNSANIMELDRERIVNNDKVQAVLWAAGGGQNAFDAIGKILSGTVNPSGRTTDTWSADFKKDPTWKNFGNNNVGYYGESTAGNQYTLSTGSTYTNNFGNGVYENAYEEGIYLDYKYYETRGFTDGDAWYSEAVNYPFGYGLSYTTFQWDVGELKLSTDTLNEKTELSVDVTVTNTGTVAGKDVVELYFSAPYTEGATEKAHVVLGAFAKTDLLRPGASQTVTLTFNGFDMASFDTYDLDGDGHMGYELDAGTYTLYVGRDAHDAWTNGTALTVDLGSDLNIDTDPVTGADISVLFTEMNEEMKGRTLSRADWVGTWPTTPLWFEPDEGSYDPLWVAEMLFNDPNFDPDSYDGEKLYLDVDAGLVRDEEWLSNYDMPLVDGATPDNAVVDPAYDSNNSRRGGAAPWYAETAPAFRAEEEAYTAENPAPIQLSDMADVPYGDAKWDEFVSQLTVNQTYEMIAATQFQFNAVPGVGSPVAGHSDGPLGLQGAWVGGGNAIIKPFSSEKFSFATETMVGATWNVELAYEEGRLVGEYGLWANIVGWYAPGANIHRSPFSGRNFEYYSADAVLSAYMLKNVVKGARDKGMVTFMKHFALNDQETNRDTNSVSTWADEKTMREIYLKPFEWAVKFGGSNGAMSAFNRLGFDWCGASYELLTALTRNEWGMKGVVITDAHADGCGSMLAGQMVRAGNDMSLDSREGSIARIVNSEEANTPTQLNAIHESAKRIFYTVLHSAAMCNGYPMDVLTYDTVEVTSFDVTAGAPVNVSVADGAEGDSYTLLQGDLPDGLTLDCSTGTISGTVAYTNAPGTYEITVGKAQKGIGEGEEYLFGSIQGGFAITGTQTFTFNLTNPVELDPTQSVAEVTKTATINGLDYYTMVLTDGTEYYFTVEASAPAPQQPTTQPEPSQSDAPSTTEPTPTDAPAQTAAPTTAPTQTPSAPAPSGSNNGSNVIIAVLIVIIIVMAVAIVIILRKKNK